MKYRLPRVVHLGLGYKIKVALVPQSFLRELADDDDEQQNYDGIWLDERKTIYIDKALRASDRREVYWHELIHALNDTVAADRPRPKVL